MTKIYNFTNQVLALYQISIFCAANQLFFSTHRLVFSLLNRYSVKPIFRLLSYLILMSPFNHLLHKFYLKNPQWQKLYYYLSLIRNSIWWMGRKITIGFYNFSFSSVIFLMILMLKYRGDNLFLLSESREISSMDRKIPINCISILDFTFNEEMILFNFRLINWKQFLSYFFQFFVCGFKRASDTDATKYIFWSWDEKFLTRLSHSIRVNQW